MPRQRASKRKGKSPSTGRRVRSRGRGSRLASLVSAVKSTAKVVARRRIRRSAPARTPQLPAAASSAVAAQPRAPITRVSVVRKPARGPSRRAARSPTLEAPRAGAVITRIPPQEPAGIESAHRPPETAAPSSAISSRPSAPAPAGAADHRFSIPAGYGDDRIVLMVKDPWWLYAYWEIQPHTERAVRAQLLPQEVEGIQSVLRVYDVTGIEFPKQPAHRTFDIPLSGLATNWYIPTNAPNRSFIVEFGILTRTGRFLLLARSNRVTAPRFGPSEIIDGEWASSEEDYWKLCGLTAGVGMGSSAAGLKELLERKLFSPGLFSGGLFSPTKGQKARGFWLWVDAEVIVYGATDSKAHVTIQGQPITLRPDGSFSVRMALPDGTQTIPVEATAPDGEEVKSIIPSVTRQTTGQPSTSRPQRTQQGAGG